MRKKIYYSFAGSLTLISVSFMLSGCLKDRITKTYTIYRPVYTSTTAVLAAINGDPAQAIGSAGKILTRDPYIFLNDIDKGIHIIDNSDPTHPVQTAFLNIPGNEDMAVKGNTLYADMYGDLLSIDISDLHHVAVTGIAHGVFPRNAVLNGTLVELNGNLADSSTTISSWIIKDTTIVAADPGKPVSVTFFYPGAVFFSAGAPAASNASSAGTGVAGSMAKMVLVNDYLYAITESHSLGVIDVSNSAVLSAPISQFAGLDLETIYPFQNNLFLGSAEGVYIYDISNPASPQQTGIFTHGQACDPVISDGNYAYVTLHAGTNCGGASNELDVVSLSDLQIYGPAAATYQMTSPQGLSKDGDLLFVCDGSAGLKVYDATAPLNLKLVNTVAIKAGYDVMAGDHHLLLVATQGLYQYSYDDNGQTSLLSFLPVSH